MTHIKNIEGKYYAFEVAGSQVLSIGNDNPKEGRWFAGRTDSGIKYVASPSPSRKAAYQKAKRGGSYGGEI